MQGLEKARGLGYPRSDIQRVAAHYNISESEAERWLQIHPESELIPERGAGLTRGTGAGSLGIGTYSEIEIVAPGSAEAGATVEVEVKITSLVDYTIHAIPVLRVDDVWAAEGSYEPITPGGTVLWNLSFTMPEQSAKVTAESWCEDTFEWHLDDTDQKTIALAGLPSLGPLALVGGLGLLVVGAAVALAVSPKE